MPHSPLYFRECRNFISQPHSYNLVKISRSALVDPAELFDQTFITGENPAQNSLALPPVVAQTITGQTVIVDGCKRLSSINADRTISCLLIDAPPFEEWQIGLLRIFANRSRPFLPAEKIVYLRYLRRRTGDADYNGLCRLIGFSSQEIHDLAPVLDAAESVTQAVLSKALHAPCVRDFCLLSTENQGAFLQAFAGLRLSLQTERELLEWLPEIAYTQKTSVAALLASNQIQLILKNGAINNPQKIDLIRNYVYTLRFPLVAAMQQRWQEAAQKANPDHTRVHFAHSNAFEKNRLEIKINVTEAVQAKKIFNALTGLDEKNWEMLIYPG